MKENRKYLRRPVNNIRELHRAQDRVRREYQKMEKNILFSVLGLPLYSLVKKRKSKYKKEKEADRAGKCPAIKSKSFIRRFLAVTEQPVMAYFIRSWLRWQAFNLAFFLGKKLVSRIQKNKSHRKKNARISFKDNFLPDVT